LEFNIKVHKALKVKTNISTITAKTAPHSYKSAPHPSPLPAGGARE